MRLSLKKGAHAVMSRAARRKFGASRSFFARYGIPLRLTLDPFDDHGFQGDWLVRLVLGTAGHLGDFFHHVVPLDNFAEDGVLTGEPLRRRNSDKELRPVGVGAGIGHSQLARRIQAVGRALGLIGEFITWTAHSVARRISALNHEVGNNAVKNSAVIKLI